MFNALCIIFSLKLSVAVFLIIAEAKTKKDELIVYVNDLEECEFSKNSVLIF